jgi:ABC-type glucose/galactose transport system permease subunit
MKPRRGRKNRNKTKMGRNMYAIGGNIHAAEY